MGQITKWLGENWWWLTVALGIAIQLLNASTRRWSEHKGVVSWLLWVTEVFSILRSAGDAPGKAGNLKLPILPTKNGKVTLLPFVLVIAVGSLSACGTTARGYLVKGLDAVALADKIAIPVAEKACIAAVSKCGKVPPEKCAPFQRCHAALVGYQSAMATVGKGLAEANRALELLGVP